MHLLRIVSLHRYLSVTPTGRFLSSGGFSLGNFKISKILLQILSFGCEIALRPIAFLLHRIAMVYLSKCKLKQFKYVEYLTRLATNNTAEYILKLIENSNKQDVRQKNIDALVLITIGLHLRSCSKPILDIAVFIKLLEHIDSETKLTIIQDMYGEEHKKQVDNIIKNKKAEQIFTLVEKMRLNNRSTSTLHFDDGRLYEHLVKTIVKKYLELGDIDINILNRILQQTSIDIKRHVYRQAADIMRITDAFITSAMIKISHQMPHYVFKEYAENELEELKKRHLPVQMVLSAHLPNNINQIIMGYEADTQRMLIYAIQMLLSNGHNPNREDEYNYNLFLYKLAEFYVDYEGHHPNYQDFDKAIELYEYLPDEPSQYGHIRNELYGAMKKTNLSRLSVAQKQVLQLNGDLAIKSTLQELRNQIEDSNLKIRIDEASLEEVVAVLRRIDANNQ